MKIQELCTTCIGLDTLGYIVFSGNMGMATSIRYDVQAGD
jgi:hypothetical protein